MNVHVVKLAKELNGSETWQVEVFGGLCFQVLSEFSSLQKAHAADKADPSLLAWRARNLLELSIWSIYFSKNSDNARCLYVDAGRDAQDLLTTVENWGLTNDANADWVFAIKAGKLNFSSQAISKGIQELDTPYMRINNVDNEIGIQTQFTVMNKFLSKFAHPTAMQILGSDDTQRSLQSNHFYELGCYFFSEGFRALENSTWLTNPKKTP